MGTRGQSLQTGVPVTSRRDIRSLTGLRAIAATLVVLLHFQRVVGPYLDQVPVLRSVVNAGWLGVDLFFVLSGFVLTLSYLDELGARFRLGTAWRFVVARVARVWPAWAVVTVVMAGFLGAWRVSGFFADVYAPHPPVNIQSLGRQLTMTQMWDRTSFSGASYVVPGWSISAEWLAYLAFPLLALLVKPLLKAPAWVSLVLSVAAMSPLAVSAFQHGTVDVEQNWLTRIACGFAAGIFAAIAYRRIERTPRVESVALTGSLVLLGWIVSVFLWNGWRRAGDLDHDYAGTAVILFPLLVLALSLTDRGPAAFLSRPAMVYGGKISYCLYLVHFIVIDVYVDVMWRKTDDLWTYPPGFTLALPALVVAPFLLAAALHRWVEEPARRRILSLNDVLVARLRRTPDRDRVVRAVDPRRPAQRPARVPVPVARTAEPTTARLAAVDAGPVPGDGRRRAPRPGVPVPAVGAASRLTSVSTGT